MASLSARQRDRLRRRLHDGRVPAVGQAQQALRQAADDGDHAQNLAPPRLALARRTGAAAERRRARYRRGAMPRARRVGDAASAGRMRPVAAVGELDRVPAADQGVVGSILPAAPSKPTGYVSDGVARCPSTSRPTILRGRARPGESDGQGLHRRRQRDRRVHRHGLAAAGETRVSAPGTGATLAALQTPGWRLRTASSGVRAGRHGHDAAELGMLGPGGRRGQRAQR